MKVHTNIKAGGIGTSGTRTNHNETLIRNKEEEKKRLRKKLRLNKETVRELKDSELKTVAGRGFPSLFTCAEKTCCNHNETLVRNKEEEKKRLRKKLRLNKETVRELKDSELKTAAGGATSGMCSYFTRCFPC